MDPLANEGQHAAGLPTASTERNTPRGGIDLDPSRGERQRIGRAKASAIDCAGHAQAAGGGVHATAGARDRHASPARPPGQAQRPDQRIDRRTRIAAADDVENVRRQTPELGIVDRIAAPAQPIADQHLRRVARHQVNATAADPAARADRKIVGDDPAQRRCPRTVDRHRPPDRREGSIGGAQRAGREVAPDQRVYPPGADRPADDDCAARCRLGAGAKRREQPAAVEGVD